SARPRPRPLAPAPAPSPRIAPARPALPRTWSPLAFRGSHRTAPRLRPDLDHRTRFVDDHLELLRPVVARMPGVDRLQTALCEPCPRFLVPGEAKDVLAHPCRRPRHEVVDPLSEQPLPVRPGSRDQRDPARQRLEWPN